MSRKHAKQRHRGIVNRANQRTNKAHEVARDIYHMLFGVLGIDPTEELRPGVARYTLRDGLERVQLHRDFYEAPWYQRLFRGLHDRAYARKTANAGRSGSNAQQPGPEADPAGPERADPGGSGVAGPVRETARAQESKARAAGA